MKSGQKKNNSNYMDINKIDENLIEIYDLFEVFF